VTCAAFRDYLRPRDAKMERETMLFNNHSPAHLKQLINLRNIHIDFLPPSTKEPLHTWLKASSGYEAVTQEEVCVSTASTT
jgi:hypothetical protein